MNREIKCRAWDNEEKEMIYDVEHTYDYHCSGFGASEESFGTVLDNDRYIVMQYVGLKDKNNNKIYEGDIVILSVYSHEEPIDDYEGQIGITPYGVGVLGYNSNGDHDFYYLSEITDSINIFEVIGNIHENPELLEK